MAKSRDGSHLYAADLARSRNVSGGQPLRLLIPKGSRANIDVVTRKFTDLTGTPFHISEVSVREIATSLIVRKLQGRQDFDVALPPTYEIPDLVSSEAILPLHPQDDGPESSQGYAGALYANGDGFDDLRYGYQTDGDVYLMFLNTSLLRDKDLRHRYADQTGKDFGTPASWQDFDAQVRFVHKTLERPGAVLFRSYGQIEWEFWVRLHAKGVWPLSADFDPQFDTDAGEAALEEMIAISPYIDPSFNDGQSFMPAWRRFADTGAFATFGWGGTQKIFSTRSFDLADALTVAPLPGGSERGTPSSVPYFNWGWSYTIAQGATDVELALAFIRFAVSPEISTEAVRQRNGFFDPFRPEHYRDQTIRKIYGAGFLREHQASLSGAIPDFYIANRAAYFETLASWLKLALDGTVRPAEALRNAADHWRLLSSEAGQDKQAVRWRQLRASYPPEISAQLRDIKS